MTKDPKEDVSPDHLKRMLSRRSLLAGSALAAGAGVVAWREFGHRGDQQPGDGRDDVAVSSPETSTGLTVESSRAIRGEVSDEGFDLSLGPVRVSAPAGVAEKGTAIVVSLPDEPLPAESDSLTRMAGRPVSIVLGDDQQPALPVTIAFDLRGTDLAANASEISPLAVMSWSGTPESFAIITGDWDATSETLTIITDHFSWFWTTLVDIGSYITDTLKGFLGLTFAEPSCAFNPLTLGSTPYSIAHTGGDPLWPCIEVDRNGKLVVELHSNSNMAWAVTSLPVAAGSVSGGWKDLNPGLATIYQGIFKVLGQHRAAVMPGGSVRLPFDPAGDPIQVEVKQSPVLFMVASTLQVVVSVLQALPTGQIAKNVLETFSAFDCVTDVIDTFYQEESADVARSTVTAVMNCLPQMVEENAKSAPKRLMGTALALAGLLAAGANAIVGALQGAYRELTGEARVVYTISPEIRSAPAPTATTDSIGAHGPSLAAPIVVRWRGDELGRTFAPVVMADGSVYGIGEAAGIAAFDIATGQEQWRATLALGILDDPPVIAGDLVLATTTISDVGGQLQAFDRETGIERWQYGVGGRYPTTPAFADGMIYVCADRNLYELDPAKGNELRQLREMVGSTPIASHGVVYVYGFSETHDSGALIAIDIASGTERWAFPLDIAFAKLTVAPGTVYSSSGDDQLHAIDAETGAERWRRPLGGGFHFGASATEASVFIDGPGGFTALDVETGAVRWTFSNPMDDAYPSSAVADGIVYVTGSQLYALDEGTGEEIWRLAVGEASGWPWVGVGEGFVCVTNGQPGLIALGNLPAAVLRADVVIRGTPSQTGLERGKAEAGATISALGSRDQWQGSEWAEVTINGVTGWIPIQAIDPGTLPREGESEYVFRP